MTIILSLANSEQTIQVSDRRLSCNGSLVDDEAYKHGVFFTANARFTFGFTGLAKWDTFETHKWLMSSLMELGPPEFQVKPILDRLADKATEDFANLPVLTSVPAKDKRLTIMFSGYLDFYSPPMLATAILTNFLDVKTGQCSDIAWDKFKFVGRNEKTPRADNPFLMQIVGSPIPISQRDISLLEYLLTERKPANAIIGKAVEMVRNMADHPAAAGTIGKQLSSIILPRAREPKCDVISEYHTMEPKPIIYMTPMVVSTKEHQGAYMAEVNIDESTIPNIVFPKVAKNARCPCGSRKKYKNCNGKRTQ